MEVIVKQATVGEIQKNFARVLGSIRAGEEILVTRRGKPVARIVPLHPRKEIAWPDFLAEAVTVTGPPVSDDVIREREERF